MKRVMEDLRKRRKALGLSQMELARLVGVSLLTVQTWERGVSEPKPENREKLEQVLSELEKKRKVD
ncbi:MAG: helix-turn-helix transcriptional regulator [Thermacetogeniaceae bacterium]|jgi:transcriptional regulator with XRE-family HTH domain